METPQFLTDLSIGEKVPYKLGGARYQGSIRPESGIIEIGNTLGANISIHENGLLICNNYSLVLYEIQSSHILKLESTGRNETVDKGRAGIGGFILGLLALLTLGIIALVFTHDNDRDNSTYTKRYIYYLSVKFWDINTKAEKLIMISGSKFRIRKFVTKFNNRFNENTIPITNNKAST